MKIKAFVDEWQLEVMEIDGISLGPRLVGIVNGTKMSCGGFIKRTGDIVVTEIGMFKVGKKSAEYEAYLTALKENAELKETT